MSPTEKIGGRTDGAAPCHPCGSRRRTFGSSREVGHDIHPHHFCGWRFRERGDCHESQPARREHHGRRLDERRTYRKAARLAGAAPSGRHPIGFLTNKKGVQSSLRANDFELAVAAMGRESLVVGASNDEEIDSSFSTLTQKKLAGWSSKTIPFLIPDASASFN